jgi:hypothetical protein
MSSHKIVQLLPPDLSPENLIQKIEFQRAFRQGGPRLETEFIKDKTIFHNYGHGGAAWSHAYGSAHIVSRMTTKESGGLRTEDYAILGSGFLGLATAI